MTESEPAHPTKPVFPPLPKETTTVEKYCENCGELMRLQGVGSYYEEGKDSTGVMYYFCYKVCKTWKSIPTG